MARLLGSALITSYELRGLQKFFFSRTEKQDEPSDWVEVLHLRWFLAILKFDECFKRLGGENSENLKTKGLLFIIWEDEHFFADRKYIVVLFLPKGSKAHFFETNRVTATLNKHVETFSGKFHFKRLVEFGHFRTFSVIGYGATCTKKNLGGIQNIT